jgi:glycine/D-amino acid oxidase-like deaminating enzyme
LSTALELANHGIDAVVLEANALGLGASTRNGGAVSGGVNIGKSFSGKAPDIDPERVPRLLSDTSDACALIDLPAPLRPRTASVPPGRTAS